MVKYLCPKICALGGTKKEENPVYCYRTVYRIFLPANWGLAVSLICSFSVISDRKRTKRTPLKGERVSRTKMRHVRFFLNETLFPICGVSFVRANACICEPKRSVGRFHFRWWKEMN
ncbi:MAG: hypothetical protein IJY39_09180, partial [Clostridia bacterium]|nr:hypothetical protein [Clostridia bacterium]